MRGVHQSAYFTIRRGEERITARSLIDMLSYNERRFDREQLAGSVLKGLR